MTAPDLAPTAVPTSTAPTTAHAGRPLGLTYARQISPDEQPVLAGLVYDQDRQITVFQDGRALADDPLVAETWGSHQTNFDNQPEKDWDKVD